jgi:tRNA-dihydrouridine synthase B
MTSLLYLAPLRGFTDYIFRNTFSRHFNGFDAAVTPFISAAEISRANPSHLKDILPENNPAMPIVPQIIGNNPVSFISLAEQLYEMGHSIVDWNLGCPYPMVAKKQRGSGLLPFPDKIDAFLEKTMASIPNRLSIKTRLGRNASSEIFRLMPIFNRYPLEQIVIHPRTGRQMYNGQPDLEAFEQCLELTRHRIVYNGDITDLAAFQSLAARFKTIERWMIGRAAVANPFLPAIIKEGKEDFTNKVETFRQFYEELFEHYRQVFSGPGHLLARMKGFWTYFSQSFKNGRDIRKKVHRSHKLQRYLDIVARFFDNEAQWNA